MIEEIYDNTRLSSYLNCEMQGYYAHGYKGTGIISREPSVALAFGLGFHAMAETWCNQLLRGQTTEWDSIQETFRAIWDRELPGELTAKLEMLKEEEEAKKYSQKRKSQIGTADRSEKIRTYNILQDRITDHRVKKSWHNIEKIFAGHLDAIIDDLKALENDEVV